MSLCHYFCQAWVLCNRTTFLGGLWSSQISILEPSPYVGIWIETETRFKLTITPTKKRKYVCDKLCCCRHWQYNKTAVTRPYVLPVGVTNRTAGSSGNVSWMESHPVLCLPVMRITIDTFASESPLKLDTQWMPGCNLYNEMFRRTRLREQDTHYHLFPCSKIIEHVQFVIKLL